MLKVLGAVVVCVAAGVAMAAPSFAQTGWVVSDDASPHACFGQARAYYAKGGPNGVLPGDATNGTYISERKGTNPENNAQFIEDYCTVQY